MAIEPESQADASTTDFELALQAASRHLATRRA